MEQETAQEPVAVKKQIDPLTIVQMHLNKISTSIKENTVALVEMGVILRKFENTLSQQLNKRGTNE